MIGVYFHPDFFEGLFLGVFLKMSGKTGHCQNVLAFDLFAQKDLALVELGLPLNLRRQKYSIYHNLPVEFPFPIGIAKVELKNAHQKTFGIRILSGVGFG